MHLLKHTCHCSIIKLTQYLLYQFNLPVFLGINNIIAHLSNPQKCNTQDDTTHPRRDFDEFEHNYKVWKRYNFSLS